MELSIEKTQNEASKATTLILKGELDTHTSTHLDHEISAVAATSPKAMVLDMQEVSFISSSGIGVIIKARDLLQKKGLTLTLVHLQPQVKRVFEIMQLTPILHVCESRQELDEYLAKIQNRIVEEGTSLSSN